MRCCLWSTIYWYILSEYDGFGNFMCVVSKKYIIFFILFCCVLVAALRACLCACLHGWSYCCTRTEVRSLPMTLGRMCHVIYSGFLVGPWTSSTNENECLRVACHIANRPYHTLFTVVWCQIPYLWLAELHADLFSRHASPLYKFVCLWRSRIEVNVMSDEICRRFNGKQQ